MAKKGKVKALIFSVLLFVLIIGFSFNVIAADQVVRGSCQFISRDSSSNAICPTNTAFIGVNYPAGQISCCSLSAGSQAVVIDETSCEYLNRATFPQPFTCPGDKFVAGLQSWNGQGNDKIRCCLLKTANGIPIAKTGSQNEVILRDAAYDSCSPNDIAEGIAEIHPGNNGWLDNAYCRAAETRISPITISISASPTSGEAPLNIQFTSTVSGGQAPYTYLWTFEPGKTSAQQNTNYTFVNAGTYTSTLRVTDSFNQQNTASQSITLSQATDGDNSRAACQQIVNGNVGLSSPIVWHDNGQPQKCCGDDKLADAGMMTSNRDHACVYAPTECTKDVCWQPAATVGQKGEVYYVSNPGQNRIPYDVLSDGTAWIKCENQGEIKTIRSEINTDEQHQYVCVNNRASGVMNWAECCAGSSCNNNKGSSGLKFKTGESLESNGAKLYCKENFEWSNELANAPQACEKAGYKWTGTQCCGDNSAETYKDDLGGCYLGTPVMNNNIHFNRTLLFFNGSFHSCGQSFNNANIKQAPSCAVLGDFRCAQSGVWARVYGDDKQANSSKQSYNNQNSLGCCAQTSCWNGISGSCVQDQSQDPSPVNYDGNRCINGMWSQREPQYDWDRIQSGYCPNEDQCLVDANGFYFHNAIPSNYSNAYKYNYGGRYPAGTPNPNPQCINDTQFIQDHLCSQGKWKSRTGIIAGTLISVANQNSINNNYALYCDNYTNSLNTIDYALANNINVKEYLGFLGDSALSKCKDNNELSSIPCINNFCILQDREKTVFGVSLNQPLDSPSYSFADALNLGSCSNALNRQQDEFFKCSTSDGKVWYNPVKKIIIYSNSNIEIIGSSIESSFTNTIKNPINSLISFIVNVLRPRTSFGGENGGFIDYAFATQTSDYNTLYLNRKDSRLIQGIKESKQGQQFLAVNYSGFNQDLCKSVDALNPTISAIGIVTCAQSSGKFTIATKSEGTKIWQDATSKLRFNSSNEDVNTCVGNISTCSALSGTALKANETCSQQTVDSCDAGTGVNARCCTSNLLPRTCESQGGRICLTTCSSPLSASDTNACCAQNSCAPLSACGQGSLRDAVICEQPATCSGQLVDSGNTRACCIGTCTYSSCSSQSGVSCSFPSNICLVENLRSAESYNNSGLCCPTLPNNECAILRCVDGTPYGNYSLTQPYKYCDNGRLVDRCDASHSCPISYSCIENGFCMQDSRVNLTESCGNNVCSSSESPNSCPIDCGCPAGQYFNQTTGTCELNITSCSDGTAFGQCSTNKPLFCDNNGQLANKASACGCPAGQIAQGENCVAPPQPLNVWTTPAVSKSGCGDDEILCGRDFNGLLCCKLTQGITKTDITATGRDPITCPQNKYVTAGSPSSQALDCVSLSKNGNALNWASSNYRTITTSGSQALCNQNEAGCGYNYVTREAYCCEVR